MPDLATGICQLLIHCLPSLQNQFLKDPKTNPHVTLAKSTEKFLLEGGSSHKIIRLLSFVMPDNKTRKINMVISLFKGSSHMQNAFSQNCEVGRT